MKPKVKIGSGVRPATSIDRLSSMQSGTGTKPKFLSISTALVDINPDNVRNTFKTLEEIEQFKATLEWPSDALNGGLDDPLEWLDSAPKATDTHALSSFKRIVEMALSIQKLGQLQPAGAVAVDGRYRVILGSTRVMACSLLNREVEIHLLPDAIDSTTKLMAHLAENTKRENLTFTETADGYYRLFSLLIESGAIETITRKEVMSRLSLSRTHALRWRSVLVAALEDKTYQNKLLSGEFRSLAQAYDDVRSEFSNTHKQHRTTPLKTSETIIPATESGSKDDKHDGSTKGSNGSSPPDFNEANGENSDDIALHFPEDFEQLTRFIFNSTVRQLQNHKPDLAGRIQSHIENNGISVRSKADALEHIDWLMDVAASHFSKA